MATKFATASEMRALSERIKSADFDVENHDIARKVKLHMDEAANLGHTIVVVHVGAYNKDVIKALIKHLEKPGPDGTAYKVEPQNVDLSVLQISW